MKAKHKQISQWLRVILAGFCGMSLVSCDGTRQQESDTQALSDIVQDAIEDTTLPDIQYVDIAKEISVSDLGEQQDVVVPDVVVSDSAADMIDAVAVSDTLDAGAVDAIPDVFECEPVSCTLFCEYGFQLDNHGCPICACRDCRMANDCHQTMTCNDPVCTMSGSCLCECKQPVSQPTWPCGWLDVVVPYCTCTEEKGVVCDSDAHYACPNVCKPGDFMEFSCPSESVVDPPPCWCDGISRKPTCHPVCIADGALGEGYYDSCTTQLIKNMDCANVKTPDGMVQQCPAICGAIGSKSEGWYMGCATGGLIIWADCAPLWECPSDVTAACGIDTCSVGTGSSFSCGSKTNDVPWCSCKPQGALHCEPVCGFAGTKSEGWYDSCTGVLIKQMSCKECGTSCDLVGTKSEGWYSTCGDGLIAWDNCGNKFGTWTCNITPWNLCH